MELGLNVDDLLLDDADTGDSSTGTKQNDACRSLTKHYQPRICIPYECIATKEFSSGHSVGSAEDLNSLRCEAACDYLTGRFKEACRKFEICLKHSTVDNLLNYRDVSESYAICQLKLRNYKEAEDVLLDLAKMESNPSDVSIPYLLSEAYIFRERYERAAIVLYECLEVHPEILDFWQRLSIIALHKLSEILYLNKFSYSCACEVGPFLQVLEPGTRSSVRVGLEKFREIWLIIIKQLHMIVEKEQLHSLQPSYCRSDVYHECKKFEVELQQMTKQGFIDNHVELSNSKVVTLNDQVVNIYRNAGRLLSCKPNGFSDNDSNKFCWIPKCYHKQNRADSHSYNVLMVVVFFLKCVLKNVHSTQITMHGTTSDFARLDKDRKEYMSTMLNVILEGDSIFTFLNHYSNFDDKDFIDENLLCDNLGQECLHGKFVRKYFVKE